MGQIQCLKLARSGKIGGFPLGFVVFGWAGVSAYLACLVFVPESVAIDDEWVYPPLWHAIGPSHAQESIEATDRMSNMLMGMTYLLVYTSPQVDTFQVPHRPAPDCPRPQ
jgi:hypothetical protein